METGRNGGITFCGALFLVFLVLKLCSVINWSWWWITAPLWIPIAIVFIIIAISWIVYGINSLIEKIKHKE